MDFTFFHLEMSNDCERDFVAIYRGAKLNKLVGKYCGRQAPPAIIFSADEALRIEFHTDGEAGNDDPTGFALKFYKVIKCRILNNGFVSKFTLRGRKFAQYAYLKTYYGFQIDASGFKR